MQRNIFHSVDKPMNVGMGVKKYVVQHNGIVEADDSPVVTSFARVSDGVPFIGIPIPKEVHSSDIESCKHRVGIK